jgi:predicted MFS family arabinose efflux permease
VIGVVEYSWAGSTLIGVPLIALLINAYGWRAPFAVLGTLAIVGMLTILIVVEPHRNPSDAVTQRLGIRTAWYYMRQERSALGMLAYAFLLSVANDNLFVVYGAWLEKTFQLSIVALGLGTAVIGVAEFCGESLTAMIGDRFGLKKVLFVAVALTTLAYAVLPFTGGTLGFALSGLFVLFMTFEMMVVTSISVSTELLPRARATMMSGYYAAAGIGRVTGALIGVPIWQRGGIVTTCGVSAALSALALVALWWGLKYWRK